LQKRTGFLALANNVMDIFVKLELQQMLNQFFARCSTGYWDTTWQEIETMPRRIRRRYAVVKAGVINSRAAPYGGNSGLDREGRAETMRNITA